MFFFAKVIWREINGPIIGIKWRPQLVLQLGFELKQRIEQNVTDWKQQEGIAKEQNTSSVDNFLDLSVNRCYGSQGILMSTDACILLKWQWQCFRSGVRTEQVRKVQRKWVKKGSCPQLGATFLPAQFAVFTFALPVSSPNQQKGLFLPRSGTCTLHSHFLLLGSKREMVAFRSSSGKKHMFERSRLNWLAENPAFHAECMLELCWIVLICVTCRFCRQSDC